MIKTKVTCLNLDAHSNTKMATKQMDAIKEKGKQIELQEPSTAYQVPEKSLQLVNRCNVAEIEELIIEK